MNKKRLVRLPRRLIFLLLWNMGILVDKKRDGIGEKSRRLGTGISKRVFTLEYPRLISHRLPKLQRTFRFNLLKMESKPLLLPSFHLFQMSEVLSSNNCQDFDKFTVNSEIDTIYTTYTTPITWFNEINCFNYCGLSAIPSKSSKKELKYLSACLIPNFLTP